MTKQLRRSIPRLICTLLVPLALVASCGAPGVEESEAPDVDGPGLTEQSCTPYSWKECTQWYYNSCCDPWIGACLGNASYCQCTNTQFPWDSYGYCGCTCFTEYRNCRNNTKNYDCSTTYGNWFSEWRNRDVGCDIFNHGTYVCGP